jgi:preprotein translocase subunit SecB
LNEEVQKARRLISAVNLTGVRLVELHAKTSVRDSEITDRMRPRFRHWANLTSEGLKEGLFHVRAHLELHILSEEKPPVVTIKIQYELAYVLPEDFRASRSELSAFAKVNGVFNAWPYFREIVQTATLRMELPPVILPVFRVPPPQPKLDPPVEDPESSKASK